VIARPTGNPRLKKESPAAKQADFDDEIKSEVKSVVKPVSVEKRQSIAPALEDQEMEQEETKQETAVQKIDKKKEKFYADVEGEEFFWIINLSK
jgi:hypothetical protein